MVQARTELRAGGRWCCVELTGWRYAYVRLPHVHWRRESLQLGHHLPKIQMHRLRRVIPPTVCGGRTGRTGRSPSTRSLRGLLSSGLMSTFRTTVLRYPEVLRYPDLHRARSAGLRRPASTYLITDGRR